MKLALAALIVGIACAAPAAAQGLPGAADAARVPAGNYKIDTNHTQVFWTVNHMGITPLTGAFAASTGMLMLNPAHPENTAVNVTFAMTSMSTTVPAFTQHLSSNEFFDTAKYPVAMFKSTGVMIHGEQATVVGNLTIKGVTQPVTLDVRLFGAGTNPMSKRLNVGFSATATIKRSAFGLGYALPLIGDEVELHITAAFEPAS